MPLYIDEWGRTAPTVKPAPTGPPQPGPAPTETIGGIPVGQAIQVATTYINPPRGGGNAGTVATVRRATSAPPSIGGGGSLGITRTHFGGEAKPYTWKSKAKPNTNTPKRKAVPPTEPVHTPPTALTPQHVYAKAQAAERALSQKVLAQVKTGKITPKTAVAEFSKGVQKILKTEQAELWPSLEPAHGAGQGKPAWQLAPYYSGQQPTRLIPRGGALYKNPEWTPSLSQVALAALSPADLAYMHREYERNAERFGPMLRGLVEQPSFAAAALLMAPVAPEAEPFIFGAADILSTGAAVKAAAGHKYLEALFDLASVGASKFASQAANQIRIEQSKAIEADATVHAAQHAIEMHPSIIKPPAFLYRELEEAKAASLEARQEAGRLRSVQAYARRISKAFAYETAVAEEQK